MTEEMTAPVTTEPTTPSPDATTPSFSVPEQYAEKGWAKEVRSLDDVYSRLDGQQALIGKKSIPNAESTDEQWQEFHNQLRPETFDKYDLSLPEGVESEVNQGEQDLYKQLFHDIGLTPKQANALFRGHIKLEMDKQGKITAEQPTTEQLNSEFDKLLTDKLGDKADGALKATLAHALQHSQETKDALAKLPNDQMVAMVELISSLDQKIPKLTEDGAPESGSLSAPQSLQEKVSEANKLRMSPEIKDPFHAENASKRAKLKALDEEIQRAHNK